MPQSLLGGGAEQRISICSINAHVFVFVSKAYSASSAAPSTSTTRLVSSLEICRASARCMSVMVQKDATRWSADRTGEVTGHNLPLTLKTGNALSSIHLWCQHATKIEQENTHTYTCSPDRMRWFIHALYEWMALTCEATKSSPSLIRPNQTIGNKVLKGPFLDHCR